MRDINRLVQEATSQHGLLTTDQLRALGCTDGAQRRLVAAGVLVTVRRGAVRLAGFPVSWEQQVLGVILGARASVVASHRSALRLHGLGKRFTGIEFTVRYPGHCAVERAIVHRSRTLDPGSITAVAGIPVTTPARTILDVASLVPDRALARIVDHALATRVVDLDGLAALRSEVGRSGLAGLARFDRVLTGAVPAGEAESGPELRLRRLLVEAALPEPVGQHRVTIRGCRYRVDLAYPAARIALEYDGFIAHTGHHSFEADRQRQNHLVEAGWTVLRFTARDLRERQHQIVSLVRSALDRFCDDSSSFGDANPSQNR